MTRKQLLRSACGSLLGLFALLSGMEQREGGHLVYDGDCLRWDDGRGRRVR